MFNLQIARDSVSVSDQQENVFSQLRDSGAAPLQAPAKLDQVVHSYRQKID